MTELEERKVLKQELRRIKILYIAGVVISTMLAFLVFMLFQKISIYLQFFGIWKFNIGILTWVLTILTFLIVFVYWMKAFNLIKRTKEIRKKLKIVT